MSAKWFVSYSLVPMTPRDASVVNAYPNLMHSIKWGDDVGKAVVKDYLISIKTRVKKLEKYTDVSQTPHWEYSNPTLTTTGFDSQALALRLAQEEYSVGSVASVSVSTNTSFDWISFILYHWKAKSANGYHRESSLNSSNYNTGWGSFLSPVGQVQGGGTDAGIYSVPGWYNFFKVNMTTLERVVTYINHPEETITDNSITPPTVTVIPAWIEEVISYNQHSIDFKTGDEVVPGSGGGSANQDFRPGTYTPVVRPEVTDDYYAQFHNPLSTPNSKNTVYGTGSGWSYPHIELDINFTNGKSTKTWYDMVKWDAEAGQEPETTTTLPDKVLPIIPIRLNKRNITDPLLKTNTIVKSINKACKKLQVDPKTILESISSQGGMSLDEVTQQVDAEIAEEDEVGQYDSGYTSPTPAERQQRIDDMLAQEQADALEDKNDIFVLFMTSLATENKWEKELLYWTFHRYYLDGALNATKGVGDVVEVKYEIPDLYLTFSYDRIEKTTNQTTFPSSLSTDGYAITFFSEEILEPVFPMNGELEPESYTYKGYDIITLWYKDDTGMVTKLDVYKFSTALGTPKDLETWDGTLATDADDYLWSFNSINDKVGDAKDIAKEKHCIPIHTNVLAERTEILSSDTPEQIRAKKTLLKRCYEYGLSFIIVELKKVHVPWWRQWVSDLVWFITAALQIYAVSSLWNPSGWTVQAFVNFVNTQVLTKLVDLIVNEIVKELLKFLPKEIATYISVIIAVTRSGLSGNFEGLDNIGLVLELVDATNSGISLVLNEENKEIARLDSEARAKIEKLEEQLKEAKEYLKQNNSNDLKEGAGIARFSDGDSDPFRFINEEPYYGDGASMNETPAQFIQRTIQTSNPGLVTLKVPEITLRLLLDPTADMDLGTI